MITLGPFKLDKPLGRGGMGEVWRGSHVAQGTPVAIKVLSPETRNRPAYLEAFQNEVKAMAALDHPAIITVMDYGFITEETSVASRNYFLTNSPYIVMELGECGSLDQWMDRMTWADAQSILLTVLDALAHSHANGVIHRDLKPQNLLFGFADNVVKLTDFGLSHLRQDARREGRFETVWGTPAYMAPEQIRGSWRDYGPWTDLYALGCMAYELVTGRPPFLADDPTDIWYAHLQETPARWKPRFQIPVSLERWVSRLMQKEPHQRFQRAADAAFALMKICNVYSRPSYNLKKAQQSVIATITMTLEASMMLDGPGIKVPTRMLELGHGSADTSHTNSLTTLDWSSYAEDESSILLDMSDEPAQELTPWPVQRPPFPGTWRRGSAPPASPRLLGTGIHLFKVKTPRLVGRSQESERIWQDIKTACVLGQPRVILLQGPPGVGKSRLMHWLAARAHELGACEVMHASFSQAAGPQDGLLPMIARHIQCTKLGFREGMIRTSQFLKHYPDAKPDHFKQLGRILFEREDDYPTPQDADQSILLQHNYHVMVEHMQHIAKERPLLVCIDDIHWGAEGLLFMRYAMRYAAETRGGLPICFLITTRHPNTHDTHLERQLLDELTTSPQTTTINLAPLRSDDFNELLNHILPLSPKLARDVERRAGGIPLFAIQLIGSWIDNHRLQDEPSGFVLKAGACELPDDIHALMQQHMEDVDEDLHLPMLIAATLGAEVDEQEWIQALKHLPAELPSFMLTRMASSGILHQGAESRWSFSHNMMRESLIRVAREQGRWVALNMACARMLQAAHPEDVAVQERLAHHLLEAGAQRDALRALLGAAQHALGWGQLQVASQCLDRLIQLSQSLEISPKDATMTAVYLLRARHAAALGHHDRAFAEAQRAYTLAKMHRQGAMMVDSVVLGASVCLSMGDPAMAGPWIDEAHRLATLMQAPREQRAALLLRARFSLTKGELVTSRELAAQVLLEAEADSDPEHTASALALMGHLFHLRDRPERAREQLERAYKIARKLRPRLLSADILILLSDAMRRMDRADTARNLLGRAQGIFESHESELVHTVSLRLLLLAAKEAQWALVEGGLPALLERFERQREQSQLALARALRLLLLIHAEDWASAGESILMLRSMARCGGALAVEISECLSLAHQIATPLCPTALRVELRAVARDIRPTCVDQSLEETTIEHAS